MADTLTRTEFLPIEPVRFNGARLSLEPPMARYSLRASDRGTLEAATGRKLPSTIGETADGAVMLGPDEWLLRLPEDGAVECAKGKSASVVEISERQVAIAIEGPMAVDIVLAGSPLDVERFPVGTGRRTIFEGVEIVLIREDEDRFVIEVWRSFAQFVWGILAKAGSEL